MCGDSPLESRHRFGIVRQRNRICPVIPAINPPDVRLPCLHLSGRQGNLTLRRFLYGAHWAYTMQETFVGKIRVCHILTHLPLRRIFLFRRISLYCPAESMLNFRRHSCPTSGGFRYAATLSVGEAFSFISRCLKSGHFTRPLTSSLPV
jgi:hypothetical protein